MTTVTSELLRPADVDETRYAAFVAKTLRSYRRYRDQGNEGMHRYRDYAGWTDRQCQEAADFYCGCYRHQFRVLVPVAGA